MFFLVLNSVYFLFTLIIVMIFFFCRTIKAIQVYELNF